MPPGGRSIRARGQPVPAPSYPSGETTYRAVGTEPFWDMRSDANSSSPIAATASASTTRPRRRSMASRAKAYRTQRLEVNIVHRQCNDGTSDRSYRHGRCQGRRPAALSRLRRADRLLQRDQRDRAAELSGPVQLPASSPTIRLNPTTRHRPTIRLSRITLVRAIIPGSPAIRAPAIIPPLEIPAR
jgi:hypothetical protein